ncbi:MAG: hypothetical protein WCD79_19315 [Chthoniobacteraceae bacterium]
MKYSRYLLALFFTLAGANHFLHPAPYLSIMPPWVPFPALANWISGAAEIAGGLGVLITPLRTAAAWGLILLLVAVFPANIHMALQGGAVCHIPSWILWARLPLQFVFAAWVYFSCLGSNSRDRLSHAPTPIS